MKPATELTLEQLRSLAEGLKACTLPAAHFHHREHCLVCAYLLSTEPQVDWRVELPRLIRRYNLAMGGANTDSSGYHETITRFYLDAIEALRCALPRASPLEFCRTVLSSPLADKDYPLRFYSRERLFSAGARRSFAPADL